MADAKPSGSKNDDTIWLWVGGLALGALVLIPAALAAALYWSLRGRLQRRDWALLGGAGLIAAIIGRGFFVEYFTWLRVLVLGDGNRLAIPFVALVVYALLVAAIAGLLEGTFVAAKLPKLWKPKTMLDTKTSILPTDKQLRQLENEAPDVLTPDVTAHSATHESEVGKRSFPIGVDPDNRPVFITEQEIGMHGLLFGSTGSGKSVTIQVLAASLLDLGWSGMILDLKEDTKAGGLRDWCVAYAHSHSIPYQELKLSDSNPRFWFNPLAGLSRDEARDTILSLSTFDDDYYQQICKKMLGQLLKLMYWANQVDPTEFPLPTVYDIAKIMSAPSLPSATKKMRAMVQKHIPGVEEEEFHTLARPDKTEEQQAKSWGAKLGNLYETEAGRTVLRATEGREMMDVTRPGLAYIGLDSTSKADLSKIISSAVLQRMSVDAAQRTTGATTGKMRQKFLIVDEASVVDRDIVQALLSKARSAGISLILATQGPNDWMDRGGDDYDKLVQNTNVVIIMSQGSPEAARLCAEYIGMEEYMNVTYSHRDGEEVSAGSMRQDRDYLVSPDKLRRLEIGRAVVRVGKPTEKVSWVKVIPRNPESGPQQTTPSSGAGTGPLFGGTPGIAKPPF